MASGDPVVQVIDVSPPAANFAPLSRRVGGSTPAENVHTWLFDAAAVEYLDFKCILRGYDGGGLTFFLPWSAATATVNDTVWSVAIRRVQDDAEDIDSAHTYVYNDVTDTAPSVSGELSYPTVTFTDGADMDSWAEGEVAIVRVRRFATDAADDMAGDAELWAVEGRET